MYSLTVWIYLLSFCHVQVAWYRPTQTIKRLFPPTRRLMETLLKHQVQFGNAAREASHTPFTSNSSSAETELNTCRQPRSRGWMVGTHYPPSTRLPRRSSCTSPKRVAQGAVTFQTRSLLPISPWSGKTLANCFAFILVRAITSQGFGKLRNTFRSRISLCKWLMFYLLGQLVEGTSQMDISKAEHVVCNTWDKPTFD